MIFNILKALILDDLIEFVDFWFLHFPRNLIRNYFDQIYSFDVVLKLRANLRNITKPLYGDYSLVGYCIAFPYRVFRIIFALIFYFFIGIFYCIFLIFWLILPIFLLSYGIHGILFSK